MTDPSRGIHPGKGNDFLCEEITKESANIKAAPPGSMSDDEPRPGQSKSFEEHNCPEGGKPLEPEDAIDGLVAVIFKFPGGVVQFQKGTHLGFQCLPGIFIP